MASLSRLISWSTLPIAAIPAGPAAMPGSMPPVDGAGPGDPSPSGRLPGVPARLPAIDGLAGGTASTPGLKKTKPSSNPVTSPKTIHPSRKAPCSRFNRSPARQAVRSAATVYRSHRKPPSRAMPDPRENAAIRRSREASLSTGPESVNRTKGLVSFDDGDRATGGKVVEGLLEARGPGDLQ